MTLTEFKDWALGQGSVGKYTDGQFVGECVSLINQYLGRVFGIQAGAWGNAKDWPSNPNVLALFDTVGSPQAGDIGVMGSNFGGGYGHIFVYLSSSTILEQNGRVARTITTGAAYANPIAILRRKGTAQGEDDMIPDADHLNALFRAFRGRQAQPDEVKQYVGSSYSKLVESLDSGDERKNTAEALRVGQIAVHDKWDQQIYGLQALVKELQSSGAADPATIDALAKQADDLEQSIKRLKS